MISTLLHLLTSYGTGPTTASARAYSGLDAVACPNTRSSFDILWSCWATILICTWSSMHPNLPPPGQGTLHRLWTRLVLMFWALIVPELILTWAVKQWLAAMAIEKEFKKDHKWTKTHAHFLGMGGFILADTGRGAPVSDVPQISNLTPPIQPTEPTRKDGDWERYWKEMETFWEEMTRYGETRQQFWTDWESAQKNCSDYTYSLSNYVRNRKDLQEMDKEDYQFYEKYGEPLPTRIAYLYESPGILSFYRFRDLVNKSVITFPTITAAEIKDRSKGDFLSKAIAIFHTAWFVVQCSARGIKGLAITELELVTLALASLNGFTYFFWWDKPLGVDEPVKVYFRGVMPVRENEDEQGFFTTFLHALRTAPQQLSSTFSTLRSSISDFICNRRKEAKNTSFPVLILTWFFYLPIATVVKSLYAIIDTGDIPAGATHVPMFYATNDASSNLDNRFIYIVLPFLSIVFGGLHCIAWNFVFPTPVERLLWRVSSLAITIIPLVTGFLWYLYRERLSKVKVLIYPASALLAFYVLARLTLLVQSLALLTREPASAYQVVDWSRYLPHIS